MGPETNAYGQEIGYARSLDTRDPDSLYMHNQDTSYNADYGKVETGYGYTPNAHTHQGRAPAGYSAPRQDYRYGDGIYDRV